MKQLRRTCRDDQVVLFAVVGGNLHRSNGKRPATSMHWRPQQLVASYCLATRSCSYFQSSSARGSRLRKRAFTSSSTACAAETSAAGANPYPFPQKSRPTPLEIFHLTPSATPKQIKHRCTHPSLADFVDSTWLGVA